MTSPITNTTGFLSLRGYTTSRGEVSDYLINGACNYAAYNDRLLAGLRTALDRLDDITVEAVQASPSCSVESLVTPSGKPSALAKRLGDGATDRDFAVWCLAEVRDSLLGKVARAEGTEVVPEKDSPLVSVDGLRGVYTHRDTGETHVHGLLVRKTSRDATEKRLVKSRPETLLKRHVEALIGLADLTPTYVSFRLGADNWDSVRGAGTTLTNDRTAVATGS